MHFSNQRKPHEPQNSKRIRTPPLLTSPTRAYMHDNTTKCHHVGKYLSLLFLFSFFLSIFSVSFQAFAIMDERAAIPVTLPRANPTKSYWQDPPDPEVADFLSNETLPGTANTVIIGSGITGACTAWNLLQKSDYGRIVMLEARQACSGATGRNGTVPLSSHSVLEL